MTNGGQEPGQQTTIRLQRRTTLIAALMVFLAIGIGLVSMSPSATAAEADQRAAQTRRLYLAYFLREPDAGGWEYWNNHEWGLVEISDYFAQSEEFKNTYGDLDDGEFVDLIYRNVLDREAEAEGYDYWYDLIHNKDVRRGRVMLAFSESEEFVIFNPLPTTTTTAPTTTSTTSTTVSDPGGSTP